MAPVDVVLLGGGGSRRMGTDKASLVVAGRRLIDHLLDELAELAADGQVGRVVVVAPESLELPDWVLQTMENPPGGGPVAGVLAGLDALGSAPDDWFVVLTCDAPRAAALVPELAAAQSPDLDGALVSSEGHVQYLLAGYRVAALRAGLGIRDAHGASMHRLVARLRTRVLPAEPGLATDLDDPAAVDRWLAEREDQ